MEQPRLWFCLKFSIALEFFFIDCIVSIDYSYINREIINSLPFLSRWNSCIKYLLSKFFIITLFFFLKVWSHCLHAGNYQYSLSDQSKYASALFMMLFWEALTADNSSLAHTMFAKYSTCSFFILIKMEVLIHLTKVAWIVDQHNDLGKTNMKFEKLCLFQMTTNKW